MTHATTQATPPSPGRPSASPAGGEQWFDEVVSLGKHWVQVRVTTPDGRSVLYRVRRDPLFASME